MKLDVLHRPEETTNAFGLVRQEPFRRDGELPIVIPNGTTDKPAAGVVFRESRVEVIGAIGRPEGGMKAGCNPYERRLQIWTSALYQCAHVIYVHQDSLMNALSTNAYLAHKNSCSVFVHTCMPLDYQKT